MTPKPGQRAVLAALAAVLTTSCASTMPLQTPDAAVAEIISLALTAPPSALAVRAMDGDARAQYALGAVYAHGLNGAPVLPVLAEALSAQAMSPRGVMPITQYTPAFNGAPSRVNLIHVPRHDLDHARAATVDLCLTALSEAREPPPVCRTEDVGPDRLAELWRAALGH